MSIIIFGAILPIILPPKTEAQVSGIGIANYLTVNNNKVEDGDIVSSTPKGYFLSTIAYDTQITGVVTKKPAISLKTDADSKGYPIISTGTVHVKVAGTAGAIKKGDFITTSSIPGVGMKVSHNGYVLGQALEDVSFAHEKDVKTVLVSLNVHYLQLSGSIKGSILDIFNVDKLAQEKPARVLQYVVAAIIAIVSFASGFVIFARTLNTGLEAIGRNPLAARMIQLSMVFNLFLVVVVVMAGAAIAYFVIRL